MAATYHSHHHSLCYHSSLRSWRDFFGGRFSGGASSSSWANPRGIFANWTPPHSSRGVRLSSLPSRSKHQNSRAKIPPATQAIITAASHNCTILVIPLPPPPPPTFFMYLLLSLFLQSRCPTPDGFIDDLNDIRWSPVRNNDINWNFEKILIDHNGQPKVRYTAPYEPNEIEEHIMELMLICQQERRRK